MQPDGDHTCSDFLPLATTTIAEKLTSVGYACHFIGKGHLGYQTTDHLPANRGFASHVGYLLGAEKYEHGCLAGSGACSADPSTGAHDFWENDAPATSEVPRVEYSADYYAGRAVSLIEAHPTASPLFLFLALQNVHAPYELPPAWQVRDYPKMGATFHVYANMLALLDDAVANVTAALRRASLYDSTLMLFSADNGGTLTYGNNFPLMGHKHDAWEGGSRVTAFLAGGFLPPSVRGAATHKLVHIADWYPTFCNLGGADPADAPVIAGAPRPIDGVDVWPLLTGASEQPRPLTVITEVSAIEVEAGGGAYWKLVQLAGQSNRYTPEGDQLNGSLPCLEKWQPDPPQPGRTDALVNGPAHDEKENRCAVHNATRPGLYELLADPTETTNVADAHPDIVARLAAAIAKANAGAYVTGSLDNATLARYTKLAPGHWGGFTGPCYAR